MESVTPLEVQNQQLEYLPPIDASIDEFYNELDSQLEQYSDAAREVKLVTDSLLSDESIIEFTRSHYPDFDDNNRPNRKREKTIKDEMTRIVKMLITDAKLMAQIYTDPDADPENRQNIITNRNTPETTGQILHSTWNEVFDAEVKRSNTERELRQTISTYLEQDETNVIELTKTVSNLEGEEYRPLLAILYKDTDDPFVDGIVGNSIRKLQDSPEFFQDQFLARIRQEINNSPEDEQDRLLSSESLSWLHWLNSHKEVNSSALDLLSSQDSSTWPESLQAALSSFADDILSDAWIDYVNKIKQYENRSIYSVDPDSLQAMHLNLATLKNQNNSEANTGRGKRKTAKRTTRRANYNEYLEPENPEKPQFAFSSITIGNQVSRTWQRSEEELAIEGDELDTEAILNLSLVQNYLSKYNGDPNIRGDLLLMMNSILREPYHNGASKMKHQAIRLQCQPHSKQLSIWHLNPNKRAGLSIGDIGRRTRIYYAILPAERQLILLDISHKADADKLSSSEFRRTS